MKPGRDFELIRQDEFGDLSLHRGAVHVGATELQATSVYTVVNLFLEKILNLIYKRDTTPKENPR